LAILAAIRRASSRREADIGTQSRDVRFVPEGDICTAQKNQSGNGHGRGCVPTQKLRPKLRIGHRKRGGTGHEDEGHDKTVLIEATIAAQAKQTICLAG
jgi:hypothetical protein